MRLVLPRMGVSFYGFKAVYDTLGFEVVYPPPLSKRTMDLGVRYAPEYACYPFKITLGNLIEALEDNNGDIDVVATAGGVGPCRYGYYGVMYNRILKRDLGYDFELEMFDPPTSPYGSWSNIWKIIRRWKGNSSWVTFFKLAKEGFVLAWNKLKVLEKLEERLLVLRAHQTEDILDSIMEEAIIAIDRASDVRRAKELGEEYLEKMNDVSLDWDRPVLKVGIVGEIYTVLEPFANNFIEKELGSRGVEVKRALSTTEFISENIFPKLPWLLRKIVGYDTKEKIERYSQPYLNEFVGGHGRESVAHVVMLKEEGFDGALHLLPFGCMPEIVAQAVFPRVTREIDFPVLSLTMDEQTAEAGVITRIEAFLDLLWMRKKKSIALSM